MLITIILSSFYKNKDLFLKETPKQVLFDGESIFVNVSISLYFPIGFRLKTLIYPELHRPKIYSGEITNLVYEASV